MYYVLWIVLWILAILIVVFQIKTYQYNRRNRNIIIASLKKDIWPYWILWVIWFILLLFMLFYKWISVSWWRYVSDWFDWVKGSIKIQDEKYDDWDNISSNIYRGIITEEQVQQIIDRNGIDIIPITDWYYEIITTDDTSLPVFIDTSRYVIPTPENVNFCSIDKKYWNLWWNWWWNLWLNYNWFVYEYINSHRQKDVLVALLDSGIDWDNAVLKWHIAINSGEVKDWKDNDNDWYIDDISWVNVVVWNWNVQDYNWHWSHVAWIILQTFPYASILPIKLVDWNSEYVDEYDIIKWLRYAIDAWVDIINMSFGWKWFNEVTEALIKEANEKWIIVIAAAWNEWDDISQYYPASYTWVINVGSLWYTWISSYSNYVADILAPGECVYSYWLYEPLEYWWWTSMSAPHIAWILWTYISLWNNLSDESSALDILNNAEKKKDNMEIIDMPKLIWIEKNNDNLYSYIGTINDTLKTIQTKLNKLQQSSFTESDLNSAASYKSTLSTAASNLWKLYGSLSMNTWFWLKLKKEIEEYNKLLDQLWWFYLDIDLWWTLLNSLWVRSCNSDYDEVCDTFSIIISKWKSLPVSDSRNYVTMDDGQTSIKFEIYQWEYITASYNEKLWSISIENLPMRSKWEAWATVYFFVDTNWKLSATATDLDNKNNTRNVVINSVARDTALITWENYKKVKTMIDELLVKTQLLLDEVQSFYNLDPFKYIPEVITWSYLIKKIELDIPDFVEDDSVLDISTWDSIISWSSISTWINDVSTGIKSVFSWINNLLTWKQNKVVENIKVDRVVDGDTIRVFLNWGSVSVRLIWVNTPESNDTRYWYTECFWQASSNYLKRLLSNKYVWLEYDVTQWSYDAYWRILAYIYFNWENVNKKIIEDGYWWEYTYNLPYKYQQEFKLAEKNAALLNKWLWGSSTCNWEQKKGY